MKHDRWQNDAKRFRAMTGLDLPEFKDLPAYFEASRNEYLSRYTLCGKPRKGLRACVIYSNSPLPGLEERLAFVLSYWNLNPVQEQHADMFDMTQKQCYESVHGLSAILRKALKDAGVVPAWNNPAFHRLLEENPDDAFLLHDATEREIPRPVDDELQREMYSGKKKKHTVRNAAVITGCCLMLSVSQTLSGRIHDKTIADNYCSIPVNCTLAQDTGYRGYSPSGVRIIQPQKKPRGKDLTEDRKKENQKISSFRVPVEHAVGSVKRYRIVKDECRLRKNNFVNDIFASCAAIHNFRLEYRPFRYKNYLT